MHVFSLKYEDESICMDIRLLIKPSIFKEVQKDALLCALTARVNYIYKQKDTKLESGGKHQKNKAIVWYWQV